MAESYGAIEDLLDPSQKATVDRKTNYLHRLVPNPIIVGPTCGFVCATFVAVLLGVALVAYMVFPDLPREISANFVSLADGPSLEEQGSVSFDVAKNMVDTSLEEQDSATHVSLEEAINVILDAVKTAKETADKALEHADNAEEALANLSDMIQNATESAGLARDIALGVQDNATSLANEVGDLQQKEDELRTTTDMVSKEESRLDARLSLLDARMTAAEKKLLETDEPGGGPGEPCFRSHFCEFGLVCGDRETCCIPPGSDISCEDSSTCCGNDRSGTQCSDNRCMCEFYFVKTHKTWADHKAHPPHIGPYRRCVLASIINAREQDAAYALAQREEGVGTGHLTFAVWLGGQLVNTAKHDRGWEWIDGESFDGGLAFWRGDQPNIVGSQHKIAMFTDGAWNDLNGAVSLPALFKCCPSY